MRISELFEAPVGDIYVSPISKDGSFTLPADRAIVQNPKAHAKVRRVLARIPQTLDLVFLDKEAPLPDGWRYVEHLNDISGVFSPAEAQRIHPGLPQPKPDTITLVLTHNEGAGRVQLSPWMIAHRMAHAIAFDDREGGHASAIENIDYAIRDPYAIMRDGWGVGFGRFVWHIGTMKSVREKTITQAAELTFECFAQYCVTGRVTFNRFTLEEFTEIAMRPDPDYPSKKAPTEEDLKEVNNAIRFAEMGINSIIKRLLESLVGKVVVL